MSFDRADFDTWRARVTEELGGRSPDEVLGRRLAEGLRLEPLYTTRPEEGPGPFGETPFRRGTRTETGEGRGWRIRQRYAEAGPRRLAEALQGDLAGGADSVFLDLDRPLRTGVRPQGPRDRDGRGAALYSVHDFHAAFGEADLAGVSVALAPGANALPAAATLAAFLSERDIDVAQAELSFGADPIGAFARDGGWPTEHAVIADELRALARWAKSEAPRSRCLRASTVVYHEAGAHSVQELAFLLGTLKAYVGLLMDGGLSLAEAAGQIEFALPVGRDTFVEIAKIRAARLLWSKFFVASGLEAPPAPFVHAETSRRTLAVRDPWTNLLRVSAQTFAAAVGGADAITSLAFDGAIHEPGALGRRVARNTQHVLAEESGLSRVLDPAGGSYLFETLTQDLARAAWSLFQEIEGQGGMWSAVESGWIRQIVDRTAANREERVATRRFPVVGVSAFPNLDEERPEPADGLVEPSPSERVAIRSRLTRGEPGRPLDRDDFPALREAAHDGADVFEMGAHLRGDQGPVLEQSRPFPLRRDGAAYEALRSRAEGFAEEPRCFLANLGRMADHRGPAAFADNLLAAGGVRSVEGPGTAGLQGEEAAARLVEDFRASGAPIACICGGKDDLATLGGVAATALREAGAAAVLAAGEGASLEMGADALLIEGVELLSLLDWLHDLYGKMAAIGEGED